MNGGEQKMRVVSLRVTTEVKNKLEAIKEEMGATWEDFVLIALGLIDEPDTPESIVFRTTPETFSKMDGIRKRKGKNWAQLVMEAYGVQEPEQGELSQTEEE